MFKLHWRFLVVAISVLGVAEALSSSIVFTELSDTLLTASLDGSPLGTVDFIGPDHWLWRSEINFEAADLRNQAGIAFDWQEPSPGVGLNHLDLQTPAAGEHLLTLNFEIFSDWQGDPLFRVVQDGEVGFTLAFGFLVPGSDELHPTFGPADVIFVDKGDASAGPTVPDASSMLPLLGVSVGAMVTLRLRLKIG